MFQKNISFNLIHEFQRHGIGGDRVEIHFGHDESTPVDPFGKPGSDNPFPDQRFAASHSERGQHSILNDSRLLVLA
ncbi:MAG TPA: hypothetical protein VNN22_22230 [Verrucomicrobiae bacterium]|nr:hypothetical protein [Verrucomicrobiae bacterium]